MKLLLYLGNYTYSSTPIIYLFNRVCQKYPKNDFVFVFGALFLVGLCWALDSGLTSKPTTSTCVHMRPAVANHTGWLPWVVFIARSNQILKCVSCFCLGLVYGRMLSWMPFPVVLNMCLMVPNQQHLRCPCVVLFSLCSPTRTIFTNTNNRSEMLVF